MIIIKTKNKVSKTQVDSFNDSQEENGLVKQNPTSKEDCYWLLRVTDNKLGEIFEAKVEWYQLVEYDTGNPDDPNGISENLIYREDFKLDADSVQDLWEALQGEILSTDNYLEKVQEFTAQGILIWLGQRQAFTLTSNDFEIIQ